MTELQEHLDLLSSNKDVQQGIKSIQQGIKSMLVKLRQASEKGTDWRSLDEVEKDYIIDSSKYIVIELVPAWATLENLDTGELVDLYNDYEDANIKDESEINWKDLDVKVVLLDMEEGTSETLQVFWIGEQGVIQYL